MIKQWYSEKRLIRTIEAWESKLMTGFKLPKHPVFQLEYYTGQPIQDEYQRWLCEVIKKRNSLRSVIHIVFDAPAVTEAIATEVFGEETINEARERFKYMYT